MVALRRMLAVILALTSLSVAVQFIAGEIYGVFWSDSHIIWTYLNWAIALGLVVALVFHFRRKRAYDLQNRDDSVSFNYLSSNLLLFSSLFLSLWFFANWFEDLNIDHSSPTPVLDFVWVTFNACYIVLAAITAWQLWRPWGKSGSTESASPPAAPESSVQASVAGSDAGLQPTAGNPTTLERAPANGAAIPER